MDGYIHHMLRNFPARILTFSRVCPTVDIPNPFRVAKDIPTMDESLWFIRFTCNHRFDFRIVICTSESNGSLCHVYELPLSRSRGSKCVFGHEYEFSPLHSTLQENADALKATNVYNTGHDN